MKALLVYILLILFFSCKSVPPEFKRAVNYKKYYGFRFLTGAKTRDKISGYAEDYLCNETFLITYINPQSGYLQKRIEEIKIEENYQDYSIINHQNIKSTFVFFALASYRSPAVEIAKVHYSSKNTSLKKKIFYSPLTEPIELKAYYGRVSRDTGFLLTKESFNVPFDSGGAYIRQCNPQKYLWIAAGSEFVVGPEKIEMINGEIKAVKGLNNPFCKNITGDSNCQEIVIEK